MKAQRILLIDDEADIRECVQLMVTRQGNYEFDQAANGEDGLKMILGGHYDCVVSDIKMPFMDGVSMLKKIREAGNHVPIVFISGFADDDFEYQVTDYGAVKLIHKTDIKEIGERVHEAMRLGRDAAEIGSNKFGDDFLKMLNKTTF